MNDNLNESFNRIQSASAFWLRLYPFDKFPNRKKKEKLSYIEVLCKVSAIVTDFFFLLNSG